MAELSNFNFTENLNIPRSAFGCVVNGGYVYVIGGYNGSGYLTSVEYAQIKQDGTLDEWKLLDFALKTARSNFGCVVSGGYVYAIGGSNSEIQALLSAEYALIKQDGTLDEWTPLTSVLSTARTTFGCVVSGGYVYAIGGKNNVGELLLSAEYALIKQDGTLDEWTTTSTLKTARDTFGCVVYNGYIYAIGGYGNFSYVLSAEYALIKQDGTLDEWTTTSTLKTARTAFGCVVYNGYIYALGGVGNDINLSSVEYTQINVDGTLDSWQILLTSALETARYTFGCVAYNGYVYAIGGETPTPTYLSSSEYAMILQQPICLLSNCDVLLASGEYKNITEITVDDLVMGYFSKTGCKITEVVKENVALDKVEQNNVPYIIEKGLLGENIPDKDIHISGHHRLILKSGENEYTGVQAFKLNFPKADISGQTVYYHIKLENKTEGIIVNNIPVESCQEQ